ncbi:hypothetical protein CEXT_597411 [Caerostris extrusa]|uniref:Uncharacterized protein n=1 Tax=Caerostris extrusa TaxID=172846 RepID=A0AAV4PY22_CAEEX|nr:hypothetical protein CEXT_597411 [Caerostris extrusa]
MFAISIPLLLFLRIQLDILLKLSCNLKIEAKLLKQPFQVLSYQIQNVMTRTKKLVDSFIKIEKDHAAVDTFSMDIGICAMNENFRFVPAQYIRREAKSSQNGKEGFSLRC